MSRVKFNVNTEYAYLQNFKILQSMNFYPFAHTLLGGLVLRPLVSATDGVPLLACFTKHQIDRPIPVEGLIKCKMQDNLEFLQWSKRYWDQYYPGGDYDAVARRKSAGTGAPPAYTPSVTPRTSTNSGARRPAANTAAPAAPRIARQPGASIATAQLSQENTQLKEMVTGLERERDFYFRKLRDIELLVQQAIETDPELDKNDDGLVKQIQTILYSTEAGWSTLLLRIVADWVLHRRALKFQMAEKR